MCVCVCSLASVNATPHCSNHCKVSLNAEASIKTHTQWQQMWRTDRMKPNLKGKYLRLWTHVAVYLSPNPRLLYCYRWAMGHIQNHQIPEKKSRVMQMSVIYIQFSVAKQHLEQTKVKSQVCSKWTLSPISCELCQCNILNSSHFWWAITLWENKLNESIYY